MKINSNILSIVIAGLALLFPILSHAGGEVRHGLVTGVSTWSEHVDIGTDAPFIDPDACGGGGGYYRIDLTTPGANARLASILLAYSLRKTVGLSLEGCVGTAPAIDGVRGFGP
ncbi:MAG TPA: hypothetical protein DDW49_10350 [Deltaproteobacteria bacterium]|nr:MAG: hypothetical protein A2048_08060 [Deltaproteobacteria bacterium GWA2_45_12]HBF13763.1 hypothetical protein [Deltaproteobacteria bacterium]